ncbi:MAG: hypothetical protein EON92_08205, partial [Burkholderiales bacterium]
MTLKALSAMAGLLGLHARGLHERDPLREVACVDAGQFFGRAGNRVLALVDQALRDFRRTNGCDESLVELVDAKPGAATIVGADTVAKAAADGYTILVTTSSTTINNA